MITLVALPGPLIAQADRAALAVIPVEDRDRAVECLTLAVAHEAGYESLEGRQAVAEVVLNRMRDPAFPKTVCGVVFAGSTRRTGCQFTFTCDGSLRRTLPASVVAAARAVAEQAIDGQAPLHVSGATHYHANYVKPYWAPSLTRLAKIGAHIFYRSRGASAFGTPGARQIVDANIPLVADERAPGVPSPDTVKRRTFAPWGIVPGGNTETGQ